MENLKKYFENPALNKRGFCAECGISQQHLNRILSGTRPLTNNVRLKLIAKLEQDQVAAQNLLSTLKG